jgi:hypothetical protein
MAGPARDTLMRMADVYAGVRTYVDRGVVTTTFISPDQVRVSRLPFRTAFERPDRFRYEFNDETSGDRLVIWQEAPPARLFWSVRGAVETFTLPMAIAAATGISAGSALTIPRLLMPDVIESWALTNLDDAAERGEELVDGVRCRRIDGHDTAGKLTLWIGAEDLLVRRVCRTDHFDPREQAALLASLPDDVRPTAEQDASLAEPFDTETETSYAPITDGELAPGAFAPGEIVAALATPVDRVG